MGGPTGPPARDSICYHGVDRSLLFRRPRLLGPIGGFGALGNRSRVKCHGKLLSEVSQNLAVLLHWSPARVWCQV